MDLKKVFNNFQTILIVVLVIIIFLMRECSGGKSSTTPRIERDTVIEYVTVTKETKAYVPKIKTIVQTRIDSFSTPVDTAAILADYYAQKYYDDEQELDSLYLVILDTVTQNSITGRQIKYTLKYPIKTITIKEYINQRELYYGVGLDISTLNYFGGELFYRTKKSQGYGLSIGVNNELQPVVMGRMYWKLGKK
jgi:hypothetical protein